MPAAQYVVSSVNKLLTSVMSTQAEVMSTLRSRSSLRLFQLELSV